jgi:hypothetical protein
MLLQNERKNFLKEQWPQIYATIQRLGLKAEELLNGASGRSSGDAAASKTIESKSPEEES